MRIIPFMIYSHNKPLRLVQNISSTKWFKMPKPKILTLSSSLSALRSQLSTISSSLSALGSYLLRDHVERGHEELVAYERQRVEHVDDA